MMFCFHFGATNYVIYYLWMFFKMWLPECYSVLHVIIHPLIATIHLRGVNIEHVVYTLSVKRTEYNFLGVNIHPSFNLGCLYSLCPALSALA